MRQKYERVNNSQANFMRCSEFASEDARFLQVNFTLDPGDRSTLFQMKILHTHFRG